MAKQQGKPTRKDKVEASEAAKKAAKQNAKKEASSVPKGPKPDFTPRAVHAALDRLIKARESGELDYLVQGMPGAYFVGTHNETKVLMAFDFTVKLHDDLTVIEDADGIRLPLDYLFEPAVTTQDKFMRRLAPGRVGNVQFQMLGFLQEALAPEIKIEKEVRRVRALNLRKAKEASKEVVTPTFTLATSDGVPVKSLKTINSLANLVPGAFGRYDFSDATGKHCLVDYHRRDDGVTVLEIKSLTQGHELDASGVRVGIQLLGENLAEDKPIPESAHEFISDEHFDHLVIVRAFFIARIAMAQAKARKVA